MSFVSATQSTDSTSSRGNLFSWPINVYSEFTLRYIRFKEIVFYRIDDSKKKRFYDHVGTWLGMFTVRQFLRSTYYVRSWVYATNHKRIAVNYFWFVILSGVCGMILATIIRLEMAYPGIGVLAGDSLQYLSVVTAHAVIMVFFMIMPLLFGAFGNFLLPTQLGVHDVAFPRLNSAAFWFLPGGLLMLAQLVCLDRRYHRMNCFNIRELQTLMKNRYHPELLDEKSHTDFLSKIMLSTRFKLGDMFVAEPQMSIYHEFPLFKQFSAESLLPYLLPAKKTPKRLNFAINGYNTNSNSSDNITLTSLIEKARATYKFYFDQLDYYLNFEPTVTPFYSVYVSGQELNSIYPESTNNSLTELTLENSSQQNFTTTVSSHTSDLVTQLSIHNNSTYYLSRFSVSTELENIKFSLYSFLSFLTDSVYLDYYLEDNFLGNFVVTEFSDLISSLQSLFNNTSSLFKEVTKSMFSPILTLFSATDSTVQSSSHSAKSLSLESSYSYNINGSHELPSDYRFQKTQNPIFKYDFKVGNYMTEAVVKLNRHFFTTVNDTTTGLRVAPWYFSSKFDTPFRLDALSHLTYFGSSSSNSSYREDFHKRCLTLDKEYPFNDSRFAAPSFTGGFYNIFNSFWANNSFTNLRWISMNTLDQKFHHMYTSSSMQQRVYSNWRQLRFTREGWRCRLLATRHQNTLYKRYLHEDSVFWAVERNAKDVLPGWAMITPFSARTRFTAIGKVDIGLMGVFLVLNSSIVSSANFLVTYRYLSTLNNRKMRDARSFFTEGVMVASWMMIAANPMLAIGILMLLSDRHWQTSFFDYSGGGDTVLFQHMFWFFGHPEVYVIMIPTFGFNNTILSFYLRKRVSARASLLYSMYTIAFLGFFVWGHHMYMVGLAHTTRMLFSTLTVMISVPAATKLMHWCVTIVNSSVTLELPLVFQFLFIFFFVSGGVSGMSVAHTGMDILFHDSFYVVGHFHVMLAGAAMLASFGAFYFYFPAIFGVKYSRIFGYLHLVYYLLGQLMTVIPMFWLGYSGMPRRVLDYPASMGGWHSIVSAGHLLSVAGMMAFFVMIFDSLRSGRAATRTSYGIARFNTRLNFYTFEGARMCHVRIKGWHTSRAHTRDELTVTGIPYRSLEPLESTLYSYTLLNKPTIQEDTGFLIFEKISGIHYKVIKTPEEKAKPLYTYKLRDGEFPYPEFTRPKN